MWRLRTLLLATAVLSVGLCASASAVRLPAGKPLAVPVRVPADGTVTALSLRLSRPLQGRVAVGWYADARGRPGALVATGTLAGAAAGWGRAGLAPATTGVVRGRRAWVGLLAVGTTAQAATAAGCKALGAGGTARTALPRRWPSGRAGACAQLRVTVTVPGPGPVPVPIPVPPAAPAVADDLAPLPAPATPPDTSITAKPAASTTSTSASFSFTATEGGSTFACKLDAGSYAACTSPKAYSGLAVGAHTFSVRATDAAGNVDASPATATWTVTAPADTTPPDTSITAQPAASTTSTSASFSFTATEGGATFQCKLDAGSYAVCTSPKAYTSLAVGSHTFSVRATDAAGNTDASPATATWTVTAPSAPALGAPSSSVVDAAKAVPLIRYGRQYSGGGMTNDAWNTGPSLVLAAAAYAGNTSADARLLAQVRDLIAGGNEPVSNGGYPAQHERFGTATLAVARRTPRIWGQLTAAEQHKVDLVMQGMLYSSAFTTSDTNPYVSSNGQQRTLDGDTDVHRDWNPNYREGMLGGVVQAIGYFGPATTQSLLTGYDPAAFLTDLRANGLTNLADTFNYKVDHPSSVAPSASTVAATVRTFKYYGITVADPMGLYWALTDDTFGAHVTCGLNGGAGVATADGQAGMLVSGCSGLPNQGALGMALELDSGDAGGARSSAQYAYDGAKVNVVNAYVLVVSGVWAAGADASAATARLRIGMPDLWYKLDRGYRGYAKGAAQWIYGAPSSDPYVYRSDNPNYGFPYNRTLWYDVMAPYLGL